ncbi:hypothetical protein PVT67_15555 [Gallaecimonas kandeliae]|uniref:hypothetical protein n=1 Tax=Gallaecimonas kandeliae TaxID=3029055 RepID=UPI00264A0836|nr:hypothetical protein [Gallaecimonas kandeliae]WKE65059.1 hypothetical protein PVT67_15555 [Gallaecimonas kandeliae]
MKLPWIALAILSAFLLGSAGGFWKGWHDGALSVTAAQDQAQLQSLNQVITNQRSLIKEANSASARLAQLGSSRAAQDAATTQALKEMLHETASLRAQCRFDAGVMRQLVAARARAAQAAAGGLDGAVPAAGQSGG